MISSSSSSCCRVKSPVSSRFSTGDVCANPIRQNIVIGSQCRHSRLRRALSQARAWAAAQLPPGCALGKAVGRACEAHTDRCPSARWARPCRAQPRGQTRYAVLLPERHCQNGSSPPLSLPLPRQSSLGMQEDGGIHQMRIPYRPSDSGNRYWTDITKTFKYLYQKSGKTDFTGSIVQTIPEILDQWLSNDSIPCTAGYSKSCRALLPHVHTLLALELKRATVRFDDQRRRPHGCPERAVLPICIPNTRSRGGIPLGARSWARCIRAQSAEKLLSAETKGG
jgi:hypothetical protein